ncbi:unnamed protein product [marine sediment metagenome]|uniref:Malic enzyme NAD-binding domain-containing protein n=1 Tax=marine sediment metagenome TaxID=412755 RepID=X0ZEX7_9ZZZZ
MLEGITIEEARAKIWLLGRRGLLTTKLEDLNQFQQIYSKDVTTEKTELADVVKNVKPTVLIGCSTVANAFTEEIIKTMAKHTEKPIILPLSNPNSKLGSRMP